MFEHLRLPLKLGGGYKAKQGGKQTRNPRTEQNLRDRAAHGKYLSEQVSIVKKEWIKTVHDRREEKLPELPVSIPLYLQIDPDDFDPDSLSVFGIEVIAEEEDGFIIGASADIDLVKLEEKIKSFLKEEGQSKNTAAKLWSIIEGVQWRIDQILSEGLQEKWEQIEPDKEYLVNVGVACYVKMPSPPSRRKGESEESYQDRLAHWRERKAEKQEQLDELIWKRGRELDRFIEGYNGVRRTALMDNTDSFCCQINMSGKGLKDLVLNFPYLFEVEEATDIDLYTEGASATAERMEPELAPPPEDAPRVCVIDSGIQEEHRLLEPAIQKADSYSFVPGEKGVADLVSNGGHGTRVASAVLYPASIPRSGQYSMPCWLQNARILDRYCQLRKELYPPELMERIVKRYHQRGTRMFNMSVTTKAPCRRIHMSAWAATIDKLSWEKDILFVIPTGNLENGYGVPEKPGIDQYLSTKRPYPKYLFEKACRLANPAQSAQAIVVGSVCKEKWEDADRSSFGKHGEPSAFSRVGPGIWGMIKPDVVEYGGDFIYNKSGRPSVRTTEDTSPELARSVMSGGPAVGRDQVGTSFAAPKVTHILASLQAALPEYSTLLYRALLAQSARWPAELDLNEHAPYDVLRWMGYGILDGQRAIRNDAYRITLIAEEQIGPAQAHLYSVQVPESLRRPGDRFAIRMEVCLSYKARPRRTRRHTKSYLSNWLHWESSREGESIEHFKGRILKNIELDEQGEEEDGNSFPWTIRQRRNSGVKEVNLSESTLQKDWCILESNQLPAEWGIAVIGHRGWEKDPHAEVPYALAVSLEAVAQEVEIYQPIQVKNDIEVEVEDQ